MGYEFYVTIVGKHQGRFKGESPKEGQKAKIVGLAFEYELKSPRDLATGAASGKRQHGAVKIIKEWRASTPQLFTACATNEVLAEVTLEFKKTNPQGEEEIFHTVKLTDATVSTVRQFTGDPQKHTAATDIKELEEISFTFRRIEIENKATKTMAADDWQTH